MLPLSLDSEIDAGPDSAQGPWPREELDAAPEACILAFHRKPARSRQARDRGEAARALFAQLQGAGTSHVPNGHGHFQERTAPLDAEGHRDDAAGTLSFAIGTGGRTSDAFPTVAETEAAVFGQTGMRRIGLQADGFDWAYIDERKREVLDEGSRSCNVARDRA